MKHLYKNETSIEKNLDEMFYQVGKLHEINGFTRKPDRAKMLKVRQDRLQHVVKATIERLRFFRKEYHILKRENDILREELEDLKMVLHDDANYEAVEELQTA